MSVTNDCPTAAHLARAARREHPGHSTGLFDDLKRFARYRPEAPPPPETEAELDQEAAVRGLDKKEVEDLRVAWATRLTLRDLAAQTRKRFELRRAGQSGPRLGVGKICEPLNPDALAGLGALWEPSFQLAERHGLPEARLNRVCKMYLGLTAREAWDAYRIRYGAFLDEFRYRLDLELYECMRNHDGEVEFGAPNVRGWIQRLQAARRDTGLDRTSWAVSFGFRNHARLHHALVAVRGCSAAVLERRLLEGAGKTLLMIVRLEEPYIPTAEPSARTRAILRPDLPHAEKVLTENLAVPKAGHISMAMLARVEPYDTFAQSAQVSSSEIPAKFEAEIPALAAPDAGAPVTQASSAPDAPLQASPAAQGSERAVQPVQALNERAILEDSGALIQAAVHNGASFYKPAASAGLKLEAESIKVVHADLEDVALPVALKRGALRRKRRLKKFGSVQPAAPARAGLPAP